MHEYIVGLIVLVTFIGSGNLAWHLAPALDNAGYPVKEVYSQTKQHVKELCKRLYQSEARNSLDFSNSSSSIFIIASTDDAIPAIAEEIILPDESILLHTSGSKPIAILEQTIASHVGVFYPLQTFSRVRKAHFEKLPILVESRSEKAEKALLGMVKAVGGYAKKADSTQRKATHIAAVFASNFVNHMFTLSKGLLQKEDLSFDLLEPLIKETITKVLDIGPENAQTGPAVRKDLQILKDHISFLRQGEQLDQVYQCVSEHIVRYYETPLTR